MIYENLFLSRWLKIIFLKSMRMAKRRYLELHLRKEVIFQIFLSILYEEGRVTIISLKFLIKMYKVLCNLILIYIIGAVLLRVTVSVDDIFVIHGSCLSCTHRCTQLWRKIFAIFFPISSSVSCIFSNFYAALDFIIYS